MQHPLRKKTGESGVALLFAIGFLALMIMLCVSFSMESLQSQKSASNNSNRSAAKVLAQSAVNHVSSAILRYRDQHWDSVSVNAPFGGSGTTNVLPQDFSIVTSRDSKVEHKDNLDTLLPFRTPYIGVNYGGTDKSAGEKSYENRYNTADREPNWVYVTGKSVSDGTTTYQPIVGRFAYRVLPPESSTRINYAYYINGDQRMSGGTSAEWVNDISFVGKDSVDSTYLASAPLNFYAAYKKISKKDFDLAQRFFSDGAAPGDLEVFMIRNGGVPYYCHRYNLAQAPVVTGSNAEEKVKNLLDPAEARKRISFLSFDELVDAKKTGATSKANIDHGYYQEKNYNDADKKAGLFFLGMIANDPASFASLENRRKQIAANFLDYCDDDSTPTSDVDPASWSIDMTTLPTYTGNERTLYINELALTSKLTASLLAPAASQDIDIKFTPGASAELVDIYGNIVISGKKLSDMTESEIVGKLSCGVSEIGIQVSGTAKLKGGQTDRELTFDQRIDFGKVDFKSIEFKKGSGNGGYYAASSASYENASGTGDPLGAKVTLAGLETGEYIDDFELKVTNIYVTFKAPVVLSSGGSNVDLVKLPATAQTLAVSMADADALSKAKDSAHFTVANMSAKDPRQNLNIDTNYSSPTLTGENWKKSDWVFVPAVSVNGASVAGSSLSITFDSATHLPTDVSGSKNDYADPSKPTNGASGSTLAGDLETANDPAYRGKSDNERISTAYIRNGQMKSMWELGLIHRGAAWETINLQGSSVTPQQMYDYLTGGTFAGTPYEEGDAAILDTVKLTDYAVSWGMFDVNMLRGASVPGFDYVGADTDKKIFDEMLLSLVKHTDPETVSSTGGNDSKNKTIFEEVTDGVRNGFISVFAENSGVLTSRSQIANLYDGKFDSNFPTDSSREEFIGKLMPLVKTDSALVTVFHVDIVAQTIRDVGGVQVSKIKQNGDASTPHDTTLGTFDMVTEGSETVYLDDITGQVKLRATFDCNPFTGKIKLRQIKYLD